jgi:hypothetical protein
MQPIFILGEPGTGKSFSLQYLDPKETVLINIARKDLIFPKWKSMYQKRDPIANTGNMYVLSDWDKIEAVLSAIDLNKDGKFDWVKNIIIDDFQYLMSFEFMERADEGGWDRFTEIAMHAFTVIDRLRQMQRDFFSVIMCHLESIVEGGVKKEKVKTIGKLLDEKISLEGLFTTVLYSRCYRENTGKFEYYFETQNNGKNTARSPYGLFESFTIPNNLQTIKEKLIEYNS